MTGAGEAKDFSQRFTKNQDEPNYAGVDTADEHGFVVLSEEAVIEVIGEQHVGSYVKVLDADGSSHEVEVFTKEILADHEPPEGTAHTPFAEMLKMMEATHRLI